MTSLSKRGAVYHYDSVVTGKRLRCSLGTKDHKAAARLSNRVEFALADGPHSAVWAELRSALPAASFKRLTNGVLPDEPIGIPEFEQKFLDHLSLRLRLGEISEGTRLNYDRMAKTFFDWVLEHGLKRVDDLTSDLVSNYCLWRKQSILDKGGSGRGLIMDTTVLSMLFDFAIEEGWLDKTPLKYKPRIESEAEAVHPFTQEEVQKMDRLSKSPTEALVYTLLRDTGLRCSDVAGLVWTCVDWKTRTLKVLTSKRGKRVEIPMSRDLYQVLDGAYIQGETGRIFTDATGSKHYRVVKSLGARSGVENCHPHRFRHHWVCSLLAKGATLFDVAKLIGDTTATVERHYAKWTDKQADRVRKLMEEDIQTPELVLS